MSNFPQNLSILRRRAGYTQETLAEALGISRQAVGKWEAGQALPEAATLIDLADLLGCSLDELMRETLTEEDALPAPVQGQDPEELALYQAFSAHMDAFARKMANGVALILVGLGVCALLAGWEKTEFLALPGFFAFLIPAVALFITQGMAHDDFVKAHPVIPDLCPAEEKERFRSGFRRSVALAAGGILANVAFFGSLSMLAEDKLALAGMEEGWLGDCFGCLFMLVLAFCVRTLVYWGCLEEKYGLSKYAKSEDPVTGAICGVIMLFATIIFLCAGFLQGAWHPGWVVFVVGGLLCGVVNVIRGTKKV